MEREPLEAAFDRVHEPRDRDGGAAGDAAEDDVGREGRARRLNEVGHGEGRRRADVPDAESHGGDGGECHGDQGARPVLEQQQLDREQHRGHRAAEGRGHAGGGAGGEERLALGGRHVQHLSDERAHRGPGGDDRPLGPERSAGADCDRSRERLQHDEPRWDAGPPREDPLHRLGDAVPADARRAVAREEPDDDPAEDWDGDDGGAEGMAARRRRCRRRPSVGSARSRSKRPSASKGRARSST
jgi:hypothetical protein